MVELELVEYFRNPKTARQRQYDALRDYYLNRLSPREAAEAHGYMLSSFRSLIHEFKNGNIIFFPDVKKGPKGERMGESVKTRIINLRKMNHSIYDIQMILEQEGYNWSLDSIDRILKKEGFAKLPRRTKKELGLTEKRTRIPPIATRLDFDDLSEYRFECQVGGIYYFIPYILKTGLFDLIMQSSFPGTSKLSNVNSIFSILSLKLMGHERLSKINDYNFDNGLGFFAGLNVPPKSNATSTYSYRIDKDSTLEFMEAFISKMNSDFNQFYQGETINLDFHAISHYGEKSMLEKNWVGAKHQTMKSALTFLAQDGESRMMLYENSNIDRVDAPGEIMNFIDYWLRVRGIIDQTLVFDSKLTTYGHLEDMAKDNIKFITLRRRGKKLIERINKIPDDKWETIDLKKSKRKYSRFKVYEERIQLPRTKLTVRQLVFKDHGREKPTFLITNNMDLDVETLALHYANRWLIENKISEIVDFFNVNALSSPFMIRIYFDVMLTLVADTLYRLLANDLKRYERCTPKTIFSEFINCRCIGVVNGDDVIIRMKKKKTSPILKSSPVYQKSYNVPWWNNKKCSYDWIA
jgi:DDE family transposase